jgi:hypothetical protein
MECGFGRYISVDLTTVKELLELKTLTMTLGYSHIALSYKVKAVEILENALNEKKVLQEPNEKPTIQKLYNLAVYG